LHRRTFMRRGILKERFAELLTDALRADLLEASGYRTQVLEFISLEHTPKNILIRAIRNPSAKNSPPANDAHSHEASDSISTTRQLLNLEPCQLETLLNKLG